MARAASGTNTACSDARNVVSRSGMALGLRRLGMGHIDAKALVREVDKNSIDGTVDEHEFRGKLRGEVHGLSAFHVSTKSGGDWMILVALTSACTES